MIFFVKNSAVIFIIITVISCKWLPCLSMKNKYYGSLIGKFQNRFHDVTGTAYAIDSKTIFIKDFTYDGLGPDAYFYGGDSDKPSGNSGFKIANELGSLDVLKRYDKKDLVLTLPGGKTLRDIRWISVWCIDFDINFGEVTLPDSLDYPRPRKISKFSGIHNVGSDRIIVVDAQTFLIPEFTYDGQAPDAHFWVGTGNQPGPDGIYVSDENGSNEPLGRYSAKTLVIVLPKDLTIFDIDWLSIWCVAFFVDFGHVKIPKNLNVPPSLRMLGIKPQTKLNCEILDVEKGFEVRWAIAGKSIVTQLVGRLDESEYMAFGLSGHSTQSRMVGGDVAVTWMDSEGNGYAEDYYLDAKSQCAGGRGSCPDEAIQEKTGSVRLLNSAVINGFTMLTYRRPLRAHDAYDIPTYMNQSQPVIWSMGPVNSKGEVSYHTKRLRGNLFIDFGRTPQWNCHMGDKHEKSSQTQRQSRPRPRPVNIRPKQHWNIPPIKCHEPEDGIIFAQIGPTGGEQGYSAITGHVGWGIAWYINGLLIPEINMVRGKTYTFVIEGGNDPSNPAAYHPFYISDDAEGGYEHKTEAQKRKIKVFAGVERSELGDKPIGTGRLCEWKEDPAKPANLFSSFGGYQRSLALECAEGQPGVFQWTPDANTPDTVYYQCYTHRYLGWKINILDSCNL